MRNNARIAVFSRPAEPARDVSGYVLVPLRVFEEWRAASPAAAEGTVATTPDEGDVPATDAELRQLRKLAGLGNKKERLKREAN
jgi:hypothetical protein